MKYNIGKVKEARVHNIIKYLSRYINYYLKIRTRYTFGKAVGKIYYVLSSDILINIKNENRLQNWKSR